MTDHRALIEEARELTEPGCLDGMLETEIQEILARLAEALDSMYRGDTTGHHRPTEEGLHCSRCGFSWPCRGALQAWLNAAQARAAELERERNEERSSVAVLVNALEHILICNDVGQRTKDYARRAREAYSDVARRNLQDVCALRARSDDLASDLAAAQARAEQAEQAVARWEEFDFERDNPARLVEKVLELMVERDKLKGDQSHVKAEWAAFLERAVAAEARAERLAGYVRHQPRCPGWGGGGCLCGLTAALGRAGGEEDG